MFAFILYINPSPTSNASVSYVARLLHQGITWMLLNNFLIGPNVACPFYSPDSA